MKNRRIQWVAVVAVIVGMVASAHADEVAQKVQKAFRGTILVTAEPLPEPAGDAETTIAQFRKATDHPLAAREVGGVPTWSFHYTAFLKSKPATSSLTLEFYTDDAERRYAASERLLDVDPSLTILSGHATVTEDDGLDRDRRYVVKLVGKVKGKDVTLAQTKLTTK